MATSSSTTELPMPMKKLKRKSPESVRKTEKKKASVASGFFRMLSALSSCRKHHHSMAGK